MREITAQVTKKALVTAGIIAVAGLSAAENKLDGDRIATSDGDVIIHPINHATFVMAWKNKTIYVDPVGGGKRFDGLPKPDLILVTDIHGDHLDAGTLEAVVGGAIIVDRKSTRLNSSHSSISYAVFCLKKK